MVYYISSRIPYGAHVILMFTLAFSSFVLAILVTFSSPFISPIHFLSLEGGGGDTTFGAFGWCAPAFCLDNKVGYEYGTQVNRALTGGMFLWPIAVIFLFFTTLAILPLLFVHESRALRFVGNRAFFVYAASLATLTVCLAWLYSIYGWSIAHRAFEVAGSTAHLGPAMWMGLTAGLATLIVYIIGWPVDAWDGSNTRVTGGVGRGVPPGNGYYHYKRTTRQVVPQY